MNNPSRNHKSAVETQKKSQGESATPTLRPVITLANGIKLDPNAGMAPTLQAWANLLGLSDVRIFLTDDPNSTSQYLIVEGEKPVLEKTAAESIAVHLDIMALKRKVTSVPSAPSAAELLEALTYLEKAFVVAVGEASPFAKEALRPARAAIAKAEARRASEATSVVDGTENVCAAPGKPK